MEHSDHQSSLQKPITGRHVFIAIVVFFGVIVAVNLTMATYAAQSWTGLEVKNSYVASQDYNAKLAEAEQQEALGWTSSLLSNAGEFRLKLNNSAGSSIAGGRIVAMLKRPVQESQDVPLEFTERSAGDYRARIPAGVGVWDLDLTVHVAGQVPYRQIFRVHLKG